MPLAENDTVSTIGEKGRRVWLYPQRLVGRFIRARTAVAWTLFGIMVLAPWIDIAGHPALFFDIPARRFYILGFRFFATDASYLLFFFAAVVAGIFFFTAAFGRLWCGWACPQTVFLETFARPIEILIEGPPSKRKALDKRRWTAEWIWKKGLKHSAFLVFSGAISTTSLAYFLGREGVFEAQSDPFAFPIATPFFIALTALLYFDFAWFREQTCIVVCPYGRFQSVLMDGDSLTIGYDVERGEPRGKKRDAEAGDCVDCKKCVAVCPTGIDIRKGVQMECVNCTACIDACDSIMDKLGRERGLIRYTSENILAGGKRRLLRPRVIIYGITLVAVFVGLAATLTGRQPFESALNRMVGQTYTLMPNDRVQNAMRLRIANKTDNVQVFTITGPTEIEGFEILSVVPELKVEPNTVSQFPLLVSRPLKGAHGTPYTLRVSAGGGYTEQVGANFVAPTAGESP